RWRHAGAAAGACRDRRRLRVGGCPDALGARGGSQLRDRTAKLNPSPVPDEIADALAQARPRSGPLGLRLLWFDDIDSTNDRALAWAEAGAEEGCVVLADAQSAGRGRLGRTWASPACAGIYVSVVLRPAAQAMPL